MPTVPGGYRYPGHFGQQTREDHVGLPVTVLAPNCFAPVCLPWRNAKHVEWNSKADQEKRETFDLIR